MHVLVASALHRSHTYEKLVGFPLQLPLPAVSVTVTRAVPVIVGSAVFFGAAVDDAAATAAVCADSAVAEPSVLVAVTRARIVWPASAATSTYVFSVAPRIGAHLLPPPLQLSHE